MKTEQVWDAFADGLRGFLRRRVPDRATTEDLLQETFLRIHARIGQLEDDERIAGWVYRIAKNVVADHFRKTKPNRALPEDVAAADVEDDGQPVLARCVASMAATLPEPYRDAVALTELQGLTQQQAARELGLSLSGAKSRVQRGRARLKEILLRCCDVELDRSGRVVDYRRRDDNDCCT